MGNFVTQMDFFHVRTTAGLARQVRRVLRRQKSLDFENKAHEELEKFKNGVTTKNIDVVKESLNNIYDLVSKQEQFTYKIAENELIILNEEEKLEEKDKQIIVRMDRLLKERLSHKTDGRGNNVYHLFQQNVVAPMKKLTVQIQKMSGMIREVALSQIRDEGERIKRRNMQQNILAAIRTEQESERQEALAARDERKDIKQAQRDMGELEGLYKEMESLLAGPEDEAKISKAINRLERFIVVEQDFIKRMDSLTKNIYGVFLNNAGVHINIDLMLRSTIPEGLQVLKNEGYPEKLLEELVERNKKAAQKLEKDLSNIYGKARYLHRHAA